jgi:hypothetical protein
MELTLDDMQSCIYASEKFHEETGLMSLIFSLRVMTRLKRLFSLCNGYEFGC